MKTIWKFTLRVADSQALLMPLGARVLSVQTQFDRPQLWVLLDDTETTHENRTFAICGTGHPAPADTSRFIGTFQLKEGALVFHVFETTPQ